MCSWLDHAGLELHIHPEFLLHRTFFSWLDVMVQLQVEIREGLQLKLLPVGEGELLVDWSC
jgi:hypothetical protein